MTKELHPNLIVKTLPELEGGTLVLAFSGWMDGGDVSTGTVDRLVDLLDAEPFAEIDPEPFYLYNIPGPMEIASLFRPHVVIEDGQIQSIELPSNVFYHYAEGNLVFFLGKEPNMAWRAFGDSIFSLSQAIGIRRIVFVGSFGGAVPHTREPRLYVACSDPARLPVMQERYGVRPTVYEGPGSFTSYLLSRAPEAGFEMTSLVAEIPAYLQGANPACIAAVTRRLAKILNLRVEIDPLRNASTAWELEVSTAIEENDELAAQVKKLEEQYDDELLELNDQDE